MTRIFANAMKRVFAFSFASIRGIRGFMSFVLLLAGLACGPHRNPLAEWLPSPNYSPRRPQMVVLHHTVAATFDASLLLLHTRNDGGPVSAHYLIDRDGRTAQLVADEHAAWHAGSGAWGSFRDINAVSIGIELVNTGAEPFPPAQIDALLALLEDLVRRHRIRRANVVGHADVDPVRKQDPSAHFPWKRLAEKGFGLWPEQPAPEAPPGFDADAALARIGYQLKDRAAAVRAFRRHYRGEAADQLDAEDLRILASLERQLLGAAAPAAPAPKAP